jgi:xanthine dehydrogenase molybdopterin-binding subunit B
MNSVGQPLSRLDGRRKVTGAAQYTGDVPVPQALHGAIVHSTIANGRTRSIDTTLAKKASGVVAVFTFQNMPRMNPTPKPWSHLHPHGQGYLPLQDDAIHYAGQPVALVSRKPSTRARTPELWSKSTTKQSRLSYSTSRLQNNAPSIPHRFSGPSRRQSAIPARVSPMVW